MRNSFVVILLVIVALGLSTPTMQSQSDCQPSISGPSISPSQFQGGVAPFTPIGGGEFQATTITITTTLSYNNPCDAQAAVILSLPSLSAPNNSTWISWQPFRDGAGNPMFPNPAAGVVPGHSGG
ncbi:MAG TPA: hypothetical protein VJ723_08995, partial [Candidatus Angelobacter sp.]|nr:hypothetical protein [Candidatus Angelobacter sp.]